MDFELRKSKTRNPSESIFGAPEIFSPPLDQASRQLMDIIVVVFILRITEIEDNQLNVIPCDVNFTYGD
jgi:hypothetical protein